MLDSHATFIPSAIEKFDSTWAVIDHTCQASLMVQGNISDRASLLQICGNVLYAHAYLSAQKRPLHVVSHQVQTAGKRHAPVHVCSAGTSLTCTYLRSASKAPCKARHPTGCVALSQSCCCSVQETSMRLFLCALLARKPIVTQGIVTGLNGDRFFDMYVPELGLELRIQTVDIQPAPVLSDWNKDARCDPTPYAAPPYTFRFNKSSGARQCMRCKSIHRAPVLPI